MNLTYLAMMLPGTARLRVDDLPLPVFWKTAVGLEVSTSPLFGA